MQVTPEGQALTEEQRLEREAALGDMPRGAVIGERAAERQPTPEELAFDRARATIPEEEQRAQAAAREREVCAPQGVATKLRLNSLTCLHSSKNKSAVVLGLKSSAAQINLWMSFS
jgi:hypothetical protein